MVLERFGGDGGGLLHRHWFGANWADCTETCRGSTRIHEHDDRNRTATGLVPDWNFFVNTQENVLCENENYNILYYYSVKFVGLVL